MHLQNLTSREKKTLTYKEQCPEKRRVYLDAFDLEVQVGGKTPVYVEESGFPTSQLRRYAYAPKGVCVQDKISGSHRYKSTTLIAARIGDSFTVSVLFESASDAFAFNAWLDRASVLSLLDETHVVIMDNASFHKGSETARLIAETGASLLFLPPYAPELNPIEKDFANIKRRYQYNPETSIEQIIKVYNYGLYYNKLIFIYSEL